MVFWGNKKKNRPKAKERFGTENTCMKQEHRVNAHETHPVYTVLLVMFDPCHEIGGVTYTPYSY